VTLHLDHGSPEVVLQALELGFTSAMFDGGDLPYEENVRLTRALCQAAHRAGAAFEAELGEVPRLGISGAPAILTAPQQAAEFVARTGVDALAVSLGSVHAMQRKEAELDLDRLEAIRAVVDVPLVLHGSSGVTDSSLLEGIQRGLCKVNVATQLNAAFSAAIRAHLAEHPGNVDPRKYLGPARLAMQAQVRERMDVFGVTGQAAHLWEEGRP
jgi:fructose-bisphosphate aldolase class II